MSATVVHDLPLLPRCTLTKDDFGGFLAVIEVEDLAPDRGTTSEERAAGITSLEPPTVSIVPQEVSADAHRKLIDGAQRAVAAASANSPAYAALSTSQAAAGGLLMSHLKVAMAVRGALRKLGEEI